MLLTPRRLIKQQYESCLVIPLKTNEYELDKKYRLKQALFQAGSIAAKQISDFKIKEVSFHLAGPLNQEEYCLAAIQGCILENSQFQVKKEKQVNIQEICLESACNLNEDSVQQSNCILQACLNSRLWSNQHLTPEDFESICQEEASSNPSIRVSIIKGKELKNRGYNLLYNVGKASIHPPRLIHLEYDTEQVQTALVGKGVTFDTGGLNLKTGKGAQIEKMHLDKTGACSVLAAFLAAGNLGIKEVSATLALAENSIDSQSYLPGSIINTICGLNVEINNTDAEGRLCLADAFHFLSKRYSGKEYSIIDMATLTYAVQIALGSHMAGVFGNNQTLIKKLQNAGKHAFEPVWELPITEEIREAIKSKIADICQGKGSNGSASQGAAFLETFINEAIGKDTPWAHLDIGGTAFTSDEQQPPGGSVGFGARLLLNYLLSIK